jgi:WD40 repeat protein
MCFTGDGKSLAISGEDKQIRLWHVESGLELMSLQLGQPLPSFVWRLAFSPDDQSLAAALVNGEIRIYHAPVVKNPSPFLP